MVSVESAILRSPTVATARNSAWESAEGGVMVNLAVVCWPAAVKLKCCDGGSTRQSVGASMETSPSVLPVLDLTGTSIERDSGAGKINGWEFTSTATGGTIAMGRVFSP